MKKIALILYSLCFVTVVYAQEPLKYCGTDEMSYEFYRTHPELQAQMQLNRDELKNFTQNYIRSQAGRGNPDSLYIIPVVFHIIHTYGNENISDEQVMSGLKVLNRNFRNLNPDTAFIPSAFKPIVADCEIEFRLAHIDPTGHCTSGINRLASPYTDIGDHSVKDLIHWDPSKYLNIYVVKNIANLAGHCLMPDQAAAKPEWDGMVLANTYVGDTGTSNSLKSVVLAHEAGHYLNLFHIWGGNNVPGYFYLQVGQQSNCGVGDDVDDTPPTIGWSTCNLSAASCGSTVDNVQNAMDYTYCNFMFTQGQRQRMRATLHSPMANRNNLITPQNLSATGADMTDLCKAVFNVTQLVVCAGDSLFFTDKSITAPDSWVWNFGDGGTSNVQHPGYVYYNAGEFYATITATKGGTTLVSDSVLIRVNSPLGNLPYYVQDFESIGTFRDAQFFNETDNPLLQFGMSSAGQGYNSAKAGVVRMADTTVAYSGRSMLVSPAIDLTGTVLPAFSFRYSFCQQTLNVYDELEVFISNDCGKTWLSRGKRTGNNFRSIATLQGDENRAPVDSTEWKIFSFSVPNTHCVANFMFKIELINYRGNAFYIDNINVNPTAYNGIMPIALNEVELMPNPATNFISIAGLPEQMKYRVIDMNGRVCLSGNLPEQSSIIDISALAIGMYHVSMEGEHTFANRRFVKQ